jgi:nucleotide-binding universal stress UspA family protein
MTSSADVARQRPSVVCGLDHSDHARAVAGTATVLAKRLELRLVLVHAVPANVPPLAPVWPHRAPDERGEIRRRAIDAGWRLVEGFVNAAGLTQAVGRVESGLPAECLRGVAAEEAADYIVLGTRGEGAGRAALMGSVSLTTIQTTACPVVVVPPSCRGLGGVLTHARSILCGIADRHDTNPLRVAARLAAATDLPLLPAHVVDDEDEVADDKVSARSDELLADVLIDVLATSQPANPTPAVAGGSGLLTAVGRPVIRASDPAEQLVQLAAESRAALLVVGTRGRGPLRSALLGSVSRSVACRGGVPVVICPRAAIC